MAWLRLPGDLERSPVLGAGVFELLIAIDFSCEPVLSALLISVSDVFPFAAFPDTEEGMDSGST